MREFYIVDYGEKKIYDLGSMTIARKKHRISCFCH